jgi:UDP-N-acetylmuramate dehydrogenase
MIEIKQNVSLAPLTSWLIGGPAEYLALPETPEQVLEAQEWALQKGLLISVLGGGSNVLIADQGVRGLVICLKKLTGTVVQASHGKLHIEALAGTSKSELLKIYLKHKLAPALFLAGLPGDAGGGVVMNAGVGEFFKPREFVEITEWIEILRPNGLFEKLQSSDLRWAYRHCEGWQPGIITKVGLSWPLEVDETILEKVRHANKVRLSKQPLDMPSCGSVFVNPPGHKAAQLIESCGLKGFAIGGAQVSPKHANFVVNTGDAKAIEILQVIEHVQRTVLQEKQVSLQTEVVKMGF